MAMLFIMDLKYLSNGWQAVMGIMMSFGFQIICLTYLVSFCFKSSVYAFNKIGMWYVIFGLILPMVLTVVVGLTLALSGAGSVSFLYGWAGLLCTDPFVGLAMGLFY